MSLGAEILAAAQTPKSEIVSVGGKPVHVVSLSLGEMNKFNAETKRRMRKDAGRVNEAARMIIACVRDDKGEPVWSAADEDAINALPMPVTERLTKAALRINGLTGEDDGDDAGN